jgi:hypothetical protein
MDTAERQMIKTLTATIAYWESLKHPTLPGLSSIMDKRIGKARRTIRQIEKRLALSDVIRTDGKIVKYEGRDAGTDPSTRGMAVFSNFSL